MREPAHHEDAYPEPWRGADLSRLSQGGANDRGQAEPSRRLRADGQPIGIEILAPREANELLVNAVLGELNLPPLPAGELEPLRAA